MQNNTFKLIRLYTGLSQEAFAEYIGVSRATVSLIELNERNITPNIRAKLASKFTLDDDFFAYIDRFRRLSQ